jgi:hypothetical protein
LIAVCHHTKRSDSWSGRTDGFPGERSHHILLRGVSIFHISKTLLLCAGAEH